jgi:hypothetical protein
MKRKNGQIPGGNTQKSWPRREEEKKKWRKNQHTKKEKKAFSPKGDCKNSFAPQFPTVVPPTNAALWHSQISAHSRDIESSACPLFLFSPREKSLGKTYTAFTIHGFLCRTDRKIRFSFSIGNDAGACKDN